MRTLRISRQVGTFAYQVLLFDYDERDELSRNGWRILTERGWVPIAVGERIPDDVPTITPEDLAHSSRDAAHLKTLAEAFAEHFGGVDSTIVASSDIDIDQYVIGAQD